MPEWIQPVAQLLPLSFVSTGMREIANAGATLMDIAPSLLGIGEDQTQLATELVQRLSSALGYQTGDWKHSPTGFN